MTELIWEGKYDDKGPKIAPPRITLPSQTVETVNESTADRTLELSEGPAGRIRPAASHFVRRSPRVRGVSLRCCSRGPSAGRRWAAPRGRGGRRARVCRTASAPGAAEAG